MYQIQREIFAFAVDIRKIKTSVANKTRFGPLTPRSVVAKRTYEPYDGPFLHNLSAPDCRWNVWRAGKRTTETAGRPRPCGGRSEIEPTDLTSGLRLLRFSTVTRPLRGNTNRANDLSVRLIRFNKREAPPLYEPIRNVTSLLKTIISYRTDNVFTFVSSVIMFNAFRSL